MTTKKTALSGAVPFVEWHDFDLKEKTG